MFVHGPNKISIFKYDLNSSMQLFYAHSGAFGESKQLESA